MTMSHLLSVTLYVTDAWTVPIMPRDELDLSVMEKVMELSVSSDTCQHFLNVSSVKKTSTTPTKPASPLLLPCPSTAHRPPPTHLPEPVGPVVAPAVQRVVPVVLLRGELLVADRVGPVADAVDVAARDRVVHRVAGVLGCFVWGEGD
jgi:hypothetical protein